MKKITSLFAAFLVTLFLSGVFTQTFSQTSNRSSYDYWQKKMQDPNQNFNQLVDEFDNYWKGKMIVKGSGYKQFKRWQYNWQGEVRENGTLPEPGYYMNEYYKYEQSYGTDAVVGDWEFVGYGSNPEPEGAGHGRLTCIAFHPTNSSIIYVGAPAGGLWKSTSGGNYWEVCGTDDLPTIGVSCIAIDPDDPNIIYIGTGDNDGWDTPGLGVYRSTNGGYSWEPRNYQIGYLTVSRILISPSDPDNIVISTNNGVYKTFNAGGTWIQASGIDGVVRDMVNKPGTMSIMYACVEGRFFRSDNSGITWNETYSGIPSPGHRSAIGVTPANPDKVYFFSTLDGLPYRLYISNDEGLSFSAKSVGFESKQGGYDLDITVDPVNENVVYVGMVALYKTINAGDDWFDTGSSPLHADQHALEWSPHNGNLYVGNDGGIYYSPDNGGEFIDINIGLAIGMTYRLSTSPQNPDILVCGQQDCGSFTTTGGTFYHKRGGDGMDCEVDYTTSNIIYASWQHGPISRTTGGAGSSSTWHTIGGMNGDSSIVNGVNERGGWLMPFQLHDDDPSIMFGCWRNVWRSTNVNTSNHNNISWSKISNFNDDKVCEVFEKSPANENIMYVGRAKPWSLYMTINGVASSPIWFEVTMPYAGSIKWIEAHPTEPYTFYICIKKRIYKTIDLGTSWERIDGNMPYVSKNCIIHQKGSNEHLYVGTRTGVYYRDADMPEWNWVKFKSGIPLNVPVSFLNINYGASPSQLFAGTWGRGMWKTDILDEFKPNLKIISGNCNVSSTNVEISVAFRNESEMVDASNFKLGYYLSTNNIIASGDYRITEDTILYAAPGIIIGEDCSRGVKYVEPEIPSGTYYIGALVDNYYEIDETNENDNSIVFIDQVTLSTPMKPLNLTASDGTYGHKIVLDWDPPTGLVDTVWYRVYRNTYNNPNTAEALGTVWNSNTAKWDETAEDGIDYYYWVRAAYNYLGLRPSAFSAYDIGWQYLNPPSDVDATNGVYDDRIKITWEPPENGTHFKVWKNTTTNENTASPLSTNWTSLHYQFDYDVEPGITYFYWVKAARSSTGSKPSPNFSSYGVGWVALTNAPTATASDGEYTDRVEITWNTVSGASYYRLSGSYTNDPETSNPMTAWITATSRTDGGAQRGVFRYYWVQASTNIQGTNPTGYGEGDSGWRKLEEVQNVQAADGISADHIRITWNNQTYADYFRVYSNVNPNFANADPVSYWIEDNEYNDSTVSAPGDKFYWVMCAKDTAINSDQGSYNIGWRKLFPPEVDATDGFYADHVKITWDPVPGANSYRVFRGPEFSAIPTVNLTDWSSTLNFEYNDYDVVQSERYNYFVKAAFNNYGTKPSEYGDDEGVADECANIAEDPDQGYRGVDITGSILTITHRVINNGPHSTFDPLPIAYMLTVGPPGWNIVYNLDTDVIPALAAGAYYDNSYSVNLESISGGPVVHGTYYLTILYNSWANICETDWSDNVIHWETPAVNYTDALYGTYTIGGSGPDYNNFIAANTDLMNKGISAPVIFNVRPGFYNEQIAFPSINGCSETRTILFQTEPNKSDTAEISFASLEGNYTIQFDGASNITFKNLKITSPGYTNYQGTFGRVIDFKNGANNISVQNCYIEGSSDLIHLSDDIATIYCGNSFCNDITLKDNKIRHGSWAIFLEGQSSGDDELYNFNIINNDIGKFAYTGIYMKNQKNPVIRKNLINYSITPVSQCKGIELYNIENGFILEKNKIIMEACDGVSRGIDLFACNGTDENRGFVANNFIAINSDFEEPIYGLSPFICTKFDIYHNSISLSGETYQETFCIYLDCSDEDITHDNNLKNNIFFNQSGGYAIIYGDEAINHSYITEMDYNDLYTNGSFLALYGYTNQVTDFNAWKTVSGFDSHSVSGDPLFTSQTDLHVQSAGVNDVATPLSSVQDDIDGEVRHPLYPDIGADEFTPPPPEYDIYVNDIIEPITGYNLTDQETITIEIYNIGSQNVSNFPVSYNINSGTTITETVTETLNSFDVLWYSFATKADLSEIGTYIITASTALPSDQNSANDSYTATVINLNPYNCIPLYGIGCANGDYINNFHISSLYHTESGCSENGYGDFTNMATNMTQGQSYQMEISLGYNDQYVSLWIDFNDNLIFEDEEKLVQDLYCENGGQTYSSMVLISNSALPGPHRMRVRCAWNNYPVYPCNYFQYGEAHDYTVEIYTGGGLWVFSNEYKTDCPGTDVTISIDAQGGTQPYSYLWSTGETTETIIVSPETTTGYKVFVTDLNGFIGSDSVYVNVNPKPSVTINAPFWDCEGNDIQLYGDATAYGFMKEYCITDCELPTGYCPSSALFIDNSIVEEVVLNTINNNTAGNCATYSDFTSLSTTLVKNEMYDLEVTLGTCGADNYKGAKVFVDWNRDGDFEDFFEDVAELWPVDTTYTHYTMIWVPNEAVLGNTIMRIVAVETWDTWSISPCGNYDYGETEDYTINIADTAQNQIISYDWTGPEGYSSTLQNPILSNVMPADSGYYKLTVSDGNLCTNADSLYIWIQATPFANAGPDTTICEYMIYQADPVVENYMSVTWATDGSGYFDTTYIESPSYYASWEDVQNGSVDLTITAWPNHPCLDSVASTLTLSFQQMPFAEVPPGDMICGNENYQISDVIAYNYASLYWTTNGTGYFSDSTILNPLYFPSISDIENGFVDLILNLEAVEPCTADSFYLSLMIQQEPFAYAGEDTSICSNGTLSILYAEVEYSDSFNWFTSGTGTFTDIYSLYPEYFPSQADIAAGSVDLSLVAYPMIPCSDSVVSSFILNISQETFAFAGGFDFICENTPYLLSEAEASGYTSLLWETSDTGYFDNPNELNPVYYPGENETGFIFLSLTAFGTPPCGNSTDYFYLEITPAPQAYIDDDTSICEGDYYTFINDTAFNYIYIFWETSGSGYFSDSYSFHPTYYPGTGETGQISISLTAYGNSPCEEAVSSMTLDIEITPSAFAGESAIICENETYFLADATASNYSSLLWETSGNGSFDDPNALNPTYFPGTGETGFIELSLTAYGNSPCADAYSSMNLEIIAAPLAFAGEEAIICEYETYFLVDATASNYLSLLWETSGNGSFDDPNALNPTYFPGTGETGLIGLSLTAYGNSPCADAYSAMNLEIITTPLAFAGDEAIICENESYYISDATASNYSSLLWETSGDGSFDDPNALNPTYFPGTGETGFIEFSLIAYGNSPCADAYSAMNLEIIAAPTAYAGEDASIIEGESYYIYDATATNYESLEWSTNGSGYFNDPYIINPTYIPDSGETGTVILSLSVNGFAPCNTAYSSMNLEIIGLGYPLNVGYQFVSSRIVPYSPNMLDVLANNLENIDFVRNSAGQMLRKIGPIWINSIGEWITTEGYLFRMINPDLLSISGTAIDPQTPIGLAYGYQMISYLPALPISTYDVFVDVLSNLNFVRNTDGLMFRKIGPVWINGIGDMQPGEGYLVKMNADDVLIYPESFDNLIAYKTPIPEHFKVIDGNPYDPVWTIYFEQSALSLGDEIGVFDGEMLVGAGIVNAENILENSIPVFSNLYESGNYPIFKIWSKNGEEEILITDYSYINPYGSAYMKEIFPETDEEYSMLNFSFTGISDNFKHASLTIYPNPSEGIFNISMEGLSGDLQCRVMDLQGNDYCNFEFTGITGFTVKQLDLKELPAGVYFISFTGRNFSQVKKIVIQ